MFEPKRSRTYKIIFNWIFLANYLNGDLKISLEKNQLCSVSLSLFIPNLETIESRVIVIILPQIWGNWQLFQISLNKMTLHKCWICLWRTKSEFSSTYLTLREVAFIHHVGNFVVLIGDLSCLKESESLCQWILDEGPQDRWTCCFILKRLLTWSVAVGSFVLKVLKDCGAQ